MPIPKLAAALRGQGPGADRFQVHAGAGQGPAVAGSGRNSRSCRLSRLRRDLARRARRPLRSMRSTPTSYNLGVAVGWRRFAVSGDVAKVKEADPRVGGRESAVVGVSYSLTRFTGRVAVGAERPTGHPLPALRQGDNVSLDVGGSYRSVATHRSDRRRSVQYRARPPVGASGRPPRQPGRLRRHGVQVLSHIQASIPAQP